MAMKQVQDLDVDKTIRFGGKDGLVKGSSIEGYYKGAKEVESKFGPSLLHAFQTDEGSLGVWGSAQLDSKLKGLAGFRTIITFRDVVRVPNGEMKVFDVQYDDEDTLDLGVLGTQIADAPTEEEAQEAEAAPVQQAAPAARPPVSRPTTPPAAASVARVQGLMKTAKPAQK